MVTSAGAYCNPCNSVDISHALPEPQCWHWCQPWQQKHFKEQQHCGKPYCTLISKWLPVVATIDNQSEGNVQSLSGNLWLPFLPETLVVVIKVLNTNTWMLSVTFHPKLVQVAVVSEIWKTMKVMFLRTGKDATAWLPCDYHVTTMWLPCATFVDRSVATIVHLHRVYTCRIVWVWGHVYSQTTATGDRNRHARWAISQM